MGSAQRRYELRLTPRQALDHLAESEPVRRLLEGERSVLGHPFRGSLIPQLGEHRVIVHGQVDRSSSPLLDVWIDLELSPTSSGSSVQLARRSWWHTAPMLRRASIAVGTLVVLTAGIGQWPLALIELSVFLPALALAWSRDQPAIVAAQTELIDVVWQAWSDQLVGKTGQEGYRALSGSASEPAHQRTRGPDGRSPGRSE